MARRILFQQALLRYANALNHLLILYVVNNSTARNVIKIKIKINFIIFISNLS